MYQAVLTFHLKGKILALPSDNFYHAQYQEHLLNVFTSHNPEDLP
jgi:hypothetical protein